MFLNCIYVRSFKSFSLLDHLLHFEHLRPFCLQRHLDHLGEFWTFRSISYEGLQRHLDLLGNVGSFGPFRSFC